MKATAAGTSSLGANVSLIRIALNPTCLGDFNQDGGVNGADVEFFFIRWEAGCYVPAFPVSSPTLIGLCFTILFMQPTAAVYSWDSGLRMSSRAKRCVLA